MADAGWVPLRVAWDEALYGAQGFYRRQRPADHFRTAPHVSRAFGAALVELARRHGLTSLCDVGAGGGELLAEVHSQDPDLSLVGVEIRGRPEGLPKAIEWRHELPSHCRGLVFANELLDNVACDVVELDGEGTCRVVEVHQETGDERVGAEASAEQQQWVSCWWPLTGPGERAEVGLTREALWARVCTANPSAICVAVDYGHLVGARPFRGSLSSYRKGIQTPVSFDGRHDVTAHVAFDALAAAVGGQPVRQRQLVTDLGVDATRPLLDRATTDPTGYLRDLAAASEAAELISVGGLGDFYWLVSPPR
ncbi:MAG: SAM-dependent methyltransferase [Actinomycetota bacterium]|nr:SAM-dependent methyltransferase [Actinomycetota bacterium]